MIIDNIKFSPRAHTLIKYASTYLTEYECASVHPIHIFLGAMKMDNDLDIELKQK